MILRNKGLNSGVGVDTSNDVHDIQYKRHWSEAAETVKVGPETAKVRVHDEVQFLSLILCITLPLHIPRNLMLCGIVLRQLLRNLRDRTLRDFFQNQGLKVSKRSSNDDHNVPCLRSYITSSSSLDKNVIDVPCFPARPVRPIR